MLLSPTSSGGSDSFPSVDAAARIGASKDAFFRRLAVDDLAVQKSILAIVQQELQQLIDNDADQIADYYPTVVRLAREAPFATIRASMAQLQATIQAKWPLLHERVETSQRVSYFIEDSQIEAVAENGDDALSALFRSEYLRTGRVSHFVQLLAWHKSYLDLYQQSIVSVMTREGALPLDWRSYIALMAASEMRCHYLADLQQYYFVVNGGDYEWTKGIDFISPKLFKLHELSSLLAHRPWLITSQHIADLLASDQDDSWSVSELVHAIIVMCQYHSISSIALGLGCAEEEDLSIWSHSDAEAIEERVIRYLQRGDGTSCGDGSPESNRSSGSRSDVDVASLERDETRLQKLFKMPDRRASRVMSTGDGTGSLESSAVSVDDFEFEIAEEETGFALSADGASRRRDTLWRFCGGSIVRYVDFDVRSDEYSVLHTEDFCWAEHGFPLVKRYFPGRTCQILEDQFDLTTKLTYNCFGTDKQEGIDTSPYRNAIWYYVHRIFGICDDDYDYRQVNVYLNRPTKIFIKKVACTPWKVTKDDYEHFDHTLSASEKCHVTLLVAEARKQAGLMYGLRAVMQHMR